MSDLSPVTPFRDHRRSPSVLSWVLPARHPASTGWLWLPGDVFRCASLRLAGNQLRHPDQVVCCREEVGDHLVLLDALVSRLSEDPDRLHPSEDLLDLLPATLADRVALVSRGPAVDGRVLLLGHMGNDVEHPAVADEGLGVIVLVGCDSDLFVAGDVLVQHRYGCFHFGVAVGLGELDVGHQAVLVLHQQVLGERQLGLFALALLRGVYGPVTIQRGSQLGFKRINQFLRYLSKN